MDGSKSSITLLYFLMSVGISYSVNLLGYVALLWHLFRPNTAILFENFILLKQFVFFFSKLLICFELCITTFIPIFRGYLKNLILKLSRILKRGWRKGSLIATTWVIVCTLNICILLIYYISIIIHDNATHLWLFLPYLFLPIQFTYLVNFCIPNLTFLNIFTKKVFRNVSLRTPTFIPFSPFN